MKFASLEAILRGLNDARARYLVCGGLAVAAHGFGRATFNVDLVNQLRPDNVRRVRQRFYVVRRFEEMRENGKFHVLTDGRHPDSRSTSQSAYEPLSPYTPNLRKDKSN